MSYALLKDARGWIQEASGTCDHDELTKLVNDIRHRFYNLYSEVALFVDIAQCFELQSFRHPCNEGGDCGFKSYRGVTLPRDFQTVEAMWFNGSPVALQSHWREWHTGIYPERDCRLQKLDMGDGFSSERDLCGMGRLKVLCANPADAGKSFTLRSLDLAGEKQSQTFTLGTAYQLTELPAKALHEPASVTKETTVGTVVLAEESGRILSRYGPDETIPNYRRIKVTGVPDSCGTVNIRAARRYVPLSDDFDVVESDNAPAFEEMARYLRLNRKLAKDALDIQVMAAHFKQAKALLLGEKSRSLGNATQTRLTIVTPQFTPRHRLYGRR